MNRKLVSALTALHFPPTPLASQNLRAEGIPDRIIYMTGNTIVDALEWMNNRLLRDEVLSKRLEGAFSFLDPLRRIVLVTGHRRENFDSGLEQVCLALRRLADRGDIEIVYPVHLNPRVQELAKKILVGHPRVHLIEPLPYESFVALMRRAYIIVTDSGGIQEEAPSLGKPVLVTRQETERPEAIAAGAARLVGTNKDTIVSAVTELLNNQDAYENMAQARNPFGDGKAAERIAQRLLLER